MINYKFAESNRRYEKSDLILNAAENDSLSHGCLYGPVSCKKDTCG